MFCGFPEPDLGRNGLPDYSSYSCPGYSSLFLGGIVVLVKGKRDDCEEKGGA